MKTITFSIQINATREKVWEILWKDKTYRAWTSVFNESSYAKSTWEEGSEIFFLGEGESGMYGIIETKKENEIMIFRHDGEVKNGVKQPHSNWAGNRERYYLTEAGDKTILTVELDSEDSFESYFTETFPLALQKIKQIAEK